MKALSCQKDNREVGKSVTLTSVLRAKKLPYLLVAIFLLGFAGCGGGGGDSSGPPPPTVSTQGANPVGSTTATLNGNVTPNGLATNAWFEWGPDPTLSSSTSTTSQSVGSGTTGQGVTGNLTGLTLGTPYYYRIAASNSSGTTRGGIKSFVGFDTPLAENSSAIEIGTNSATLAGDVTARGRLTQVWFEYGTDSTLTANTITPEQEIGSGFATVRVHTTLDNVLSENTTYYFRVWARNEAGATKSSSIESFTTSFVGSAPTVATLAATSVGSDNATLNGNVTPNTIINDNAIAWFEWGTDNTFVSHSDTTHQSVGSGITSRAATSDLTALSSLTTYYYRIVASNGLGTSLGNTERFATPAAPPLIAPGVYGVTITLDNGVQSSGTVYLNASGESVTGRVCSGLTGTFPRYGATTPVYGAINGNTISLKWGEGAIYRGYPPFPHEFQSEYFQLAHIDNVTLGPLAVGQPAIDAGDLIVDNNAHGYGGWVSVTSVTPKIEGSFSLTLLYDGHYTGVGTPPFRNGSGDVIPGTMQGTFSVPFDGSKTGQFTCTGTATGLVPVIAADAYFISTYNMDVTVGGGGTLTGTYIKAGEPSNGGAPEESGTVSATLVNGSATSGP